MDNFGYVWISMRWRRSVYKFIGSVVLLFLFIASNTAETSHGQISALSFLILFLIWAVEVEISNVVQTQIQIKEQLEQIGKDIFNFHGRFNSLEDEFDELKKGRRE